jgi:hypothetical protein
MRKSAIPFNIKCWPLTVVASIGRNDVQVPTVKAHIAHDRSACYNHPLACIF